MKCKFCGKDSRLIKAHIIPEAFFKRLRNGFSPPLMVTIGKPSKRAPIGAYENSILCKVCDNYFGVWDDYAQKILSDDFEGAKTLIYGGRVIGHEIENFDYTKLKLFFISLLWRASISKHDFYKGVRLGPFENTAKNMLRDKNPGSADDFGTVLMHFNHPYGKGMFDPYPARFPSGINYNAFYIAGFKAFIKTDRRPSHGAFSSQQISPGRPLRIVARELENSNEYKLMHKFLTKSNNGFR